MALITTLRKRMGKIVIGLVAFSMLAFILTDLFRSNSKLFGGSDQEIGEIAGHSISYQDFIAKVDELSAIFSLNTGRNPSSQDLDNIRNEAWNALVLEYAYGEMFEEAGITVTNAELIDMVQGRNIAPEIMQYFSNPNTGEFDKEMIVNYLNHLKVSADPQQTIVWKTLENSLIPSREVAKYSNLFEMSNFVTGAEAKALYDAQNANMTVDYFYVPFFSVADSLVTVSDSDLKKYLSEHSDEYKREESRSLSYVVFPIAPSAEDSAYVFDEITSLRDGLAKAQNDSSYVTINSESPNGYQTIADPNMVPEALKVDGELVPVGTVSEPILAGNRYHIVKLSDVEEGKDTYLKTSHILIQPSDTSAAALAKAKGEAEDLISQLKKGADFAQLAMENSTDQGSAMNGGSLGWVSESTNFVPEFKDALFGFKGTGLISEPVKTDYGYHIIKVEDRTQTVYKIARIDKELYPSESTRNQIYSQADILATESGNVNELKTNAEAQSFQVRSAFSVKKNDSQFANIQDARTIVSWAYNKASNGDVSQEVYEVGNNYIVVGLSGIQEDGTAELAQVRGEVQAKVLNEKKAEYIINKIKGMSADDYAALATSYGAAARTGSADLTLSSNTFPNVGFAPDAVGVAFSLNEGEKTQPFASSNGVLLLTATSKTTPEALESYEEYKAQVASSRTTRRAIVANFPVTFYPVVVSQNLDNAVKDLSDIEDKRYKFF